MAYRQFTLALALILTLGLAFYPPLSLAPRRRTILLYAITVAILLLPLIILAKARLLRLLAAAMALMTALRLYDRHQAAARGFRPNWRLYAYSIANPFAFNLRRVLAEPKPNTKSDILAALVNLSAGAVAVVLTVAVFRVNWAAHAFEVEHGAKSVSFFLAVQFLLNGLAAATRLLGVPATDFAGPYFLARTPAEFWRFYNRPMNQFLDEYLFKPLGGRRRAVSATLLTFAFSGVIHEYIFDLPARRFLGTQLAFFLIQGLAVAATLRLRPRGPAAFAATLLTLAFNLLTAPIFLASLNAVVPFYVARPIR